MTTFYSPVKQHTHLPQDSTREVDDLALATNPIIKEIKLTWSHPTNAGTYYVYFLINGDWVYSGASTAGTSITINNTQATSAQVRTNDIYGSNIISLPRTDNPVPRTLSATSTYAGVRLDWTPATNPDETVIVYRDNSAVFTGQVSSYTHSTGGTFKIQHRIGSGSDVLYSTYSNNVTASVLAPPPARVEPSAAAEFFLGNTRAGEPVLHICSPSVVPSNPSVDSGKTAVDWAQDFVGVLHDYGDDTFFHSDFDYLFCTSAKRITTYTENNGVRLYSYSDAIDIISGASTGYTPSGNLVLVTVIDTNGVVYPAPTAANRYWSDISNVVTTEDTRLIWYFSSDGAYNYEAGGISTTTDIAEIRIYEFNVGVSGMELVYNDLRGTDNGVIMSPTQLEVRGVEFGNSMMLSSCGTAADGDYVDSMNLADDIIPVDSSVDSLGIAVGSGQFLQILGTSGGSGWDVEMETGLIKRGGNIWFNAGRGRTRIKYAGITSNVSSTSETVRVPTHSYTGEESFYSESGLVIGYLTLDYRLRDADNIAFCATPVEYQLDYLAYQTFTEAKPIMAFATNTRTLIFVDYRRQVESGPHPDQDPNQVVNDPWFTIHYTLESKVYLNRIAPDTFAIEVDYTYNGIQGSAGVGQAYSVPGYSFSFIGIN